MYKHGIYTVPHRHYDLHTIWTFSFRFFFGDSFWKPWGNNIFVFQFVKWKHVLFAPVIVIRQHAVCVLIVDLEIHRRIHGRWFVYYENRIYRDVVSFQTAEDFVLSIWIGHEWFPLFFELLWTFLLISSEEYLTVVPVQWNSARTSVWIYLLNQ